MDDELLAQFERKSESEKSALHAGDGEAYEAFAVRDRRQLSLYIRPASDPYQWVTYRYLLHMVASPSGNRLDLVFSFMLVTLTGRNLLDIGDAISKERCAFIQQYDSGKWPLVKDGSAPFIESIIYRMNAPADAVKEK